MKKTAILSLSVLTLSTMMAMETPVLAATRNYVPTALVSHAAPADGSASKAKSSLTSATDTSLTSRTAYGVIYNDVYSSARNDLLKKFNQTNKALYMSEGLSDSFAYFNADKYLEEYADVKNGLTAQLSEEEKNDHDALRQAALSHYAEYGMLEGRDCGTAFNPVIALLAYPELYKGVSDLTPDNVRKIFQDNIHAEDTSGFSIYFYTVNDTEMLSIVRNKKSADAAKYTMKDVLDDADISVQDPSANNTSSTKDGSYSKDTSTVHNDTPEENGNGSGNEDKANKVPSVSPFVVPEKINNKAEDVTPYQLYSLKGDMLDLSLFGTATSNYNTIKDKLTNKYTMMMYMCGTNLEGNHKMLSRSIARMLQAAPKNMNIVLLLGGTDTYHSTYLNDILGNGKTGVFYLNPDKLPENINWDNVYNNNKYDQIINYETMVNLATYDDVSIGDPSLLSGFMNLSSDLFPAKDYGLIMWNHGGGVINGVCIPDRENVNDNHRFNINDLESAFRSSDLIKKGDKLGMLAFDACLMGCSEIAYNLHNYYNYMYASEEIAYGNYDYQRMFSAMDSQLGNGNATDYSMIKAIHDNYSYIDDKKQSHPGKPSLQQTAAVFDGAASEKFATALNDMGKQLNKLIQVAPENGKDVLRTLAVARMKCETLCIDYNYKWGQTDPKYVDIGELTYYLKSDLTALKEQAVKAGASDEYVNAIQKSIDSVCALRETGNLVMTSTWYNRNMVRSYTGQQATSIDDMQAKAPMSDFWRKAQGTTSSYGTSIYFPCVFNNNNNTALRPLNKYSGFYKGTGLSDYSDLMTTMVNWKLSDDYIAQKKALTRQLEKTSLFASSAIEDLGDKTSPQYMVVKFREQYDKDHTPADSFGSPMYDALVTMDRNPSIYASCSINDETGNPVTNYKRVAIYNNVSGEHFNLADSSMNTQLNNLCGFGIYQKGTASETNLDFKVLANSQNNSKLICAINNAYTDADANQYKLVRGGYDGINTYDSVYHVFHQTTDYNVFEYTGTGMYCAETKSFKKIENIKQVSFYNHYLHKTENNSTELINPWNQKSTEALETLTNYSILDKTNPVYLKRFILGTGATENLNPDNFTYNAAITFTHQNEDGKTVSTTQFSDECTIKKAEDTAENVKTDAETKADSDESSNSDTDTKAVADENVNADTITASDENTNADTNTTADANVNTDANATAGENTNADTNDAENTDHAQESGTEPESSDAPEITEEIA